MAIDHTEFDRRTDSLVIALQAAAYLGDGLPGKPTVHKGPWEVADSGPADDFELYVHRMGLPKFDYGVRGDPVDVTMALTVAAVTNAVADRETMERYVGYFAANVVRCLIANAQKAGDSGWRSGVIVDSDAVRVRDRNNTTSEVEVFEFQITFEVDQS